MFSNKFPFIEGQFLSLDCVAWKSFSFEFAQLFQLALLQNVNMLFIPVSQIFLQSARVCASECACVCLLLPFSCGTQFKLVCLPVVPISKYKPIIKAISITYTYRIASHRLASHRDVYIYVLTYVCIRVFLCVSAASATANFASCQFLLLLFQCWLRGASPLFTYATG